MAIRCLDENAVALFSEQLLSAEEANEVEAHLDACAECRRLVCGFARAFSPEADPADAGGAMRWPADGLPPGAQVGRYLVIGRVGTGGMGVVYAAYDPELDRKVALKLLRGRATPDAHDVVEERLLREAKVMAGLHHPNVATVHDVGVVGDQVFVAMEFFDGGTLGTWMRAPRSVSEVLEVLLAAGRGLSAAHAAGLVHRDFKPDNVLLGAGGRVCVTDFGLVRSSTGTATNGASIEAETPNASSLTASGTLLGTPAYMAPEQHLGRPVDARTDQYGYCMTAYEALYGERPFAGDTLDEQRAAAEAGRVRPARSDRAVPARIRQALLRGLAPDPADRWPSMDALLGELGRDPGASRRRWAIGLGAAALIAATAMVARSGTGAPHVCAGAERHLDGVWDDARRAAAERAFLATGLPFAQASWNAARRDLDAYADGWKKMHTASCEATRVHGDQSDELYSLRGACLDRRLAELSALTDLYVTADRETVVGAAAAAAALPPLSSCADAASLLARVKPPANPAARGRVDALRRELARVKALGDAGKYGEALPLAKGAVKAARSIGDQPALAEALLREGALESSVADHRSAAKTLGEAIDLAEASRHDEVAGDGWTLLAEAYFWHPDIDRSEWCVPRAEAALARVGGDTPARDALIDRRGALLMARGKLEPAAELLRGHIADEERRLGPDAPRIADTLGQLAWVLGNLGRHEELAAGQERAVAILEKAVGADHPRVGTALRHLGGAYTSLGRFDDAEKALRRSLSIYDRTYGPRHTKGVFTMLDLADLLDRRGQADAAQELLKSALSIEEATYGPKHPAVAYALHPVAEIHLRHGRAKEALEAARRAFSMWEPLVGPDHFQTAAALALVGRATLAVGRHQEARQLLEGASTRLEAQPGPPEQIAAVRFALARALWETSTEESRALELARRAAEAAKTAGPGAEPTLREIEAWIAAHR